MREPLKVGERAVGYVYFVTTGAQRYVGEVRLSSPSLVRIRTKTGDVDMHPAACRRLKKKERRRVWIQKDELTYPKSCWNAWANARGCSDYVEFVEVRRK